MSKKIKSFFSTLCLLIFLSFMFETMAKADTTGTVTATVTAQNVSVTITTGGSVAFSTINTDSTEDTTSSGVNDTETAENNGNITENFNIKAENSTSTGAGWTMGAAADSEIYTIKFCTSDCDGTPTWNAIGIDPSYETLAASIAKDGTQDFDLQVSTPTSTTDYNEQTITVTIQAVDPS